MTDRPVPIEETLPLTRKMYHTPDYNVREYFTDTTGNLHLGRLLRKLDVFSYNAASQGSDTDKLVTVAMECTPISEPMTVDNDYRLSAQVSKFWDSSLEVQIAVSPTSDPDNKLAEFYFTFVAIGDDKRPTSLNRKYDLNDELADSAENRKQKYSHQRKNPLSIDDITPEEKEAISKLSGYASPVSNSRKTHLIAMDPKEKNIHDIIFGGHIMDMAYQDAWTHAYTFLGQKELPLVTAIDRINFITPLHLNEVAEFEVSTIYTGRTSLVEKVNVYAVREDERRPVTDCLFTIVNVSRDERKPTENPNKVVPVDDSEIIDWVMAHRRKLERDK